jgi:hypothetical protein
MGCRWVARRAIRVSEATLGRPRQGPQASSAVLAQSLAPAPAWSPVLLAWALRASGDPGLCRAPGWPFGLPSARGDPSTRPATRKTFACLGLSSEQLRCDGAEQLARQACGRCRGRSARQDPSAIVRSWVRCAEVYHHDRDAELERRPRGRTAAAPRRRRCDRDPVRDLHRDSSRTLAGERAIRWQDRLSPSLNDRKERDWRG